MDDVQRAGSEPPVPPHPAQRYLDLAGVMFVQVNKDERIGLVNEKTCAVVGYQVHELVGRNWFEMCVPARQRGAARDLVNRLMEGRATPTSFESPVVSKSGQERIIAWEYAALRDDAGQITGALASGQDITERRIAEDVLHRTMDELKAYQIALDASSIVAITDAQGKIRYANDQFCAISKYEREALLGQDHRILNSGFHPKEFMRDLWDTIKSGHIWQGDIKNRAKDGSTYWVQTTIVPFLDDNNRPYQYVAIRSDITQRKLVEAALERTVRDLALARESEAQRAEALGEARDNLAAANRRIREEQAKLIQAEKLSSIGLLASGVAHEINNPLSGVMGCIKALHRNSIPDSKRGEYFETAREGLERIQQIVHGLLDYARQTPPAPIDLDAGEVIEACLRLVSPTVEKRGVHVKNRIKPGKNRLLADRSQLMQALINLLLNAVQAAPKESNVTISVARSDGRVGLRVKDRGPGMSDDLIARACDPFFSTKPEGEGTGLGLAVTLAIARAHEGDLDIKSTPGRGTTVTLWLPAREGDTEDA